MPKLSYRWFRSKGGMAVYDRLINIMLLTCCPVYKISVTIYWQQANRTGQVCCVCVFM